MCTQVCFSGVMALAHPGCESGLLALLPGSVFSDITLEASIGLPDCSSTYIRSGCFCSSPGCHPLKTTVYVFVCLPYEPLGQICSPTEVEVRFSMGRTLLHQSLLGGAQVERLVLPSSSQRGPSGAEC